MQTAQGLTVCTQQAIQPELRHAWECHGPLTKIGGADGQNGAQAVCSQLGSLLHQEVGAAALQAEAGCHQLPLGPLPRVLQHAHAIFELTPKTVWCKATLNLQHDSTVLRRCSGWSSQLCRILYMRVYMLSLKVAVQ